MAINKISNKKQGQWRGYGAIDFVLLGFGLLTIIITSIVFNSKWLIVVNSFFGIFCAFMQAKGKIATQFIGIVWFVFYCLLSYQNQYYGEVILYATIMIPLYIYGAIHWLVNRDKENNIVIVRNKMQKKEVAVFIPVWVSISIVVFFLLKTLNTSQLWFSIISFCTTLPSVYFLARRSKWNQLLFLINDIALCLLWQTLVFEGNYEFLTILGYQFFQIIYDAYGIIVWWKLEKKQKSARLAENKIDKLEA